MDEVKERPTDICKHRTTCLGCPYVDDDDYYVLCTLKNKTESRL
jgi:hypothetical protein